MNIINIEVIIIFNKLYFLYENIYLIMYAINKYNIVFINILEYKISYINPVNKLII